MEVEGGCDIVENTSDYNFYENSSEHKNEQKQEVFVISGTLKVSP